MEESLERLADSRVGKLMHLRSSIGNHRVLSPDRSALAQSSTKLLFAQSPHGNDYDDDFVYDDVTHDDGGVESDERAIAYGGNADGDGANHDDDDLGTEDDLGAAVSQVADDVGAARCRRDFRGVVRSDARACSVGAREGGQIARPLRGAGAAGPACVPTKTLAIGPLEEGWAASPRTLRANSDAWRQLHL